MSALGFVEGKTIVGDELFCLEIVCPQPGPVHKGVVHAVLGSCPRLFMVVPRLFVVVPRLFMVVPRFVHGLSTVHVLQRKQRVHRNACAGCMQPVT